MAKQQNVYDSDSDCDEFLDTSLDMTKQQHVDYCNEFLDRLLECQQEGLFSDVTIKVGRTSFSCHRLVLSAASQYFSGMFRSGMIEADKQTIELEDIDQVVFADVLEFLYSGKIAVTMDNVSELLHISDRFQLHHLSDFCVHYLEDNFDLSFETRCFSYLLAKRYNLHHLLHIQRRKLQFVLNLETLQELHSDDFQNITAEMITDVLKDDLIDMECEDAFELLTKWAGTDVDNRAEDFVDILQTVRLPDCTPEFIDQTVASHPMMATMKCQDTLKQVRLYQLDQPGPNPDTRKPDLKPEESQGCLQLIAMNNQNNYKVWDVKADCSGFSLSPDQEYDDNMLGVLANDPDNQILYSLARSMCYTGNSLIKVGCSWQKSSQVRISKKEAGVMIPEGAFTMAGGWRFRTVALYKDYLYVFGGLDYGFMGRLEFSVPTSDVEKIKVLPPTMSNDNHYDFDEKQKQMLPPMPKAVWHSIAVVFAPKIYIIGGKTKQQHKQRDVLFTQEFDTSSQTWNLRAYMPQPFVCDAVQLNENIYTVSSADRLCMRYTPSVDTWCILTGPQTRRCYPSAVAWQGRLIIGGGIPYKPDCGMAEPKHGLCDVLEVYNPENDTWHILETRLPEAIRSKNQCIFFHTS